MSGYGGYEYEAQNGDAGGGGYAGGGGFLSQSGASQGDKGEKKARDKQSLIPMTIKQVRVVGNILRQDKKETKHVYTIEDQTGMLECTMWVNQEEAGATVEERAEKMVNGSYVCVIGGLKEYNGKLNVSAYDVRPIEDFNEITHHYLEAIYRTRSRRTRSRPAAAAPPPASAFGAFNPSGGRVSADAMDTSGDGGMTADQTKVFNFYTTEGTGDEGCNVNSVASSLAMDLNQVKHIVEFLSSEGHLYSTIDDDHHSPRPARAPTPAPQRARVA
ncbi:hypothetical protein JL720_15759 [Aureococcus anophagefferens]|nr:hypothetical protein JL720_15759 [Aureococcus anophagefferens]